MVSRNKLFHNFYLWKCLYFYYSPCPSKDKLKVFIFLNDGDIRMIEKSIATNVIDDLYIKCCL